jgi:hypothetical protein
MRRELCLYTQLHHRYSEHIPARWTEEARMKLFVMTDLEGVSGIVGRSDGIGNRIENLPEARELLTEEVNATVEGLVGGGAGSTCGRGTGSGPTVCRGRHRAVADWF